jgi:hypothetical protein
VWTGQLSYVLVRQIPQLIDYWVAGKYCFFVLVATST